MKADSRGYKNLSQEYITKALLALMEEKAYDEISITEITKMAQLARRTFYLNFSSKQEVLDGYFEVLFIDFMDSLRQTKEADLYHKALAYFNFWESRLRFVLLLEKNQLFEGLIKKYTEKLADQQYFNSFKDLGKDLSEKELEILILFNAAGLWKMLEYWALTNNQESAEDMARIFCKIVRNE